MDLVQLSSSPGLRVRNRSRAWAAPWVAERLAAIAPALDALGYEVEIGDVSRQGGGPLDGHKSHQVGRDADVYAGGVEKGRAVRDSFGLLALVNLLADDLETVGATDGLAGPSSVRKVSRWPGHRYHVHLRFYDMPRPLSASLTSAALAVLQRRPLAPQRLAALAKVALDKPGAPNVNVVTTAAARAWLNLAAIDPVAAVGDGTKAAEGLRFVVVHLGDLQDTTVFREWVDAGIVPNLDEIARGVGVVVGRAGAAAAGVVGGVAEGLLAGVSGWTIAGVIVGVLSVLATIFAAVVALRGGGMQSNVPTPRARTPKPSNDEDLSGYSLPELRSLYRAAKGKPPSPRWSAEDIAGRLADVDVEVIDAWRSRR